MTQSGLQDSILNLQKPDPSHSFQQCAVNMLQTRFGQMQYLQLLG